MKNGQDPPANTNTFMPVELTDEQLLGMDHAGWLETFAEYVMRPSPVPMTPQRLGTATRLQWAARYSRLLAARIAGLERETRLADQYLQDMQAKLKHLEDLLHAVDHQPDPHPDAA
jgi:hypothetical protein